jgi:plasmid stabilization system protein ParE
MKVEFHRQVQQDLNEAAQYYDQRGIHLATRVRAEFADCINAIKSNPKRFPFYLKHPVMRRVRLKHFPYILIYREVADGVRVVIFKSERRHPSFGMERW